MGIDGPLDRVSRDAAPGALEGPVGVEGSSASSAFLGVDAAQRNMGKDGMGISQDSAYDLWLGEKHLMRQLSVCTHL